MKLNKTTRKVVAISLSLITLQSALLPNISYALTSGPSMPEYSSFEPVDATDMVNLFTGDMTYNMPLLTVPSPEGGYPLSLAYHAGIKLNEEASWVGLGWTLNPGAISRSTIVYPDDYNGSGITSYFNDNGGSGFAIGGGYGVWGATANYDSEKGWGGGVSMQIGFTNLGLGTEGYNHLGIGLPYGGYLEMGDNGTSLSMTKGMRVGPLSIGFTLSSQGIQGSASFMRNNIGDSKQASANSGDWNTSHFGIAVPILNTGFWLKYSNYSYSLHASKTEYAYGMLYYQNATVNVNSDNSRYQLNHSLEYYQKKERYGPEATNPNMITYSPDVYSVAGQGISGDIRPYRATNGSVSIFTGEVRSPEYSNVLTRFPHDQKVSFRFIGEPSNNFQFHKDPAGKYNIDYKDFSDGVTDAQYKPNTFLHTNPVNDATQKDGRLASGKYIEWFSNKELKDASTPLIADPLTTEQRARFPDDGIGAMRITNTDGTVYTYAIPVYNTYQQNHSEDPNKATNFKFSTTEMKTPYAYTWLLTSVNGSDYIDRGTVGKIDKDDWGYWVRFDYGKWTDYYHWRSPYSDLEENQWDHNLSLSYGTKQIYYLNKIVTRTHTALFVKEPRQDGKGTSAHYEFVPVGNTLHGIYEGGGKKLGRITNAGPDRHIAASLMRLNKIILFKNEDLAESDLSESKGTPMDNYFPDFHYANGSSGTIVGSLQATNPIFESNSLHLYNNVIDINDLDASNIDLSKSIKTIDFSTDYSLCKKVPNNFITNVNMAYILGLSNPVWNDPSYLTSGKLTLNSIQVKGMGGISVMPSTEFRYGSNPDYDKNRWDGWGMYSSKANANVESHQSTPEADTWSLTKIINPLGGEFNISYERDDYSKLISKNSGISYDNIVKVESDGVITAIPPYNLTDFFKASDRITIQGIHYHFTDPQHQVEIPFEIEFGISIVTANSLTLYPTVSDRLQFSARDQVKASVLGSPAYRVGGNIRASNINSSDEAGNSYATSYTYTENGDRKGISSGVVFQEPSYISFDEEGTELNSVSPMVGYSKVTVQSFGSDGNSKTGKTVYEFNNINDNSVKISLHENENRESKPGSPKVDGRRIIDYGWLEEDRSALIGTPKSIQTYNNLGLLLSSQVNEYFEAPSIGAITEGINLDVQRLSVTVDKNKETKWNNHRLLRTTRIAYPAILKSVTTTQEGITSTETNNAFDFYTGNVTEAVKSNSLLEKYKIKSVPAYTKYAGMGSKFADPANKNMLGQETANYFYSVDGSTDKLLSASVQTWKKDAWNYNEFVTDHYEDLAPTSESEKVWRKHQEYVWKSPVNQDGTVTSFTDFSWTSAPDDGWQKTNEITRYDHYSKPLESVDIKGTYSANKIGFNDSYVIANSGTSNYRSFTYTGFEDIKEVAPGKFYFGGEVYRNTGEQVGITGSVKPHTGKYMARIPTAGDYGPIYASGDIQKGKTYRGSAWVHKDSDPSTRIAAQLGGSNGSGAILIEQYMSIADPKAITVGDWKLLTVNIQVPADYVPTGGAINDLRIFVSKNPGGVAAYVDDMRLQPVNSPVTGYVWDEQRGLLTAILDNENFATLFTYDEADRLVKTEKETINGIKKVSETEYHYGRL